MHDSEDNMNMNKPASPTGIVTRLLATLALCALVALPATVAAGEDATPATEASASRVDDTPRSSRDRYRGRLDELNDLRRKQARIASENRERWHSQRRWWRNPRAEDRRQWNRNRHQWHRDMMETPRNYYRQNRPYR